MEMGSPNRADGLSSLESFFWAIKINSYSKAQASMVHFALARSKAQRRNGSERAEGAELGRCITLFITAEL